MIMGNSLQTAFTCIVYSQILTAKHWINSLLMAMMASEVNTDKYFNKGYGKDVPDALILQHEKGWLWYACNQFCC